MADKPDKACSAMEIEEGLEELNEKRKLLEQRLLDLSDLESEVALLVDEIEALEERFGGSRGRW